MRKTFLLLCALAGILSGCSKDEYSGKASVTEASPVFYASFEGPSTRTYLDGNAKLLWTVDDRLSIFTTTYNQQYAFTGETGDNSGSFEKISAGEFVTGNPLDANYAVYPYLKSTKISNSNTLSIELPAVQKYAENSFGLAANTMVAVTQNSSDYFLAFKNICGYLVIRLYGEGTVTSISMEGNNGEKIAGKCSVSPEYGGEPSAVMTNDATECITIDCGDGVTLGATSAAATEFWFCVPPTVFSKGFTVTATNTEGFSMIKSVSSSKTISRNVINEMAPLHAEFDTKIGNIQFEDASFKSYCVQNFDKDNDGEISYMEALEVEEMNVDTEIVESVKGIEHFKNLSRLTCGIPNATLIYSGEKAKFERNGQEVFGKLKELDVSKNKELISLDCGLAAGISTLNVVGCTKLNFLHCNNNQLSSLDVSSNINLEYIACRDNQLSALDVSSNINLKTLYCLDNQLSTLDVSSNENLGSLDCRNNQLSSLDVSSNINLKILYCYSNQLSSLVVSSNINLKELYCSNNQLSTLDVSNNINLEHLDCSENQLSSLDVRSNINLVELYCYNNQLSTLDVSNNINLEHLNCSENQLSSLDVRSNINLLWLYCYNNQLSTLDVSNNINLERLECSHNQLSTLDVGSNENLVWLFCSYNQLSTLDVSSNINLESLSCRDNQLSTLDVSCNINLKGLNCQYNQLSSLDVCSNKNLSQLECWNNQLSTLDVSCNINLKRLACGFNPYLTEIWLKQGQTISYFTYDNDIATIRYRE